MDTVGADDEVVAAGRAVREDHLRRLAVLQVRHRRAEPDRHLGGGLEKHLVQRRAMNRDAAADAVPQPVDVDVGEKTAAVVEEALPPDRVGAGGDDGSDAELVQMPVRRWPAGTGRRPSAATRSPARRPQR